MRRAVYRAGSAGMTPGREASRLRWDCRRSTTFSQTAHLYVPQSFFTDAAEHYRSAGQTHRGEPLSRLAFDDPVVFNAASALLRAAAAGAPNLYAESVAQWLATHLLASHSPWRRLADDPRDPGPISDPRLARVIEFMSAHLGQPLTLDRLAREAGTSKFHFARLFRRKVGVTPLEFLLDLRMDSARRMLATTDLTVSAVAASCGYPRPEHFGAAFSRRFGLSPSSFRNDARS